ncbi:MAG: peptide chain release factor N(5)-glutamine methyltransferase [Flavobacteriales bacterium]|nr:peptide chain release factor N(5)-glutamine methyltransferase [Flavobacteriales bacterium]
MKVADNSVEAVIRQYQVQLSDRHPPDLIKVLVRMVFAERLGWDAARLEVSRKTGLSESELLQVYDPLRPLVEGVPIQYVLGSVLFHGLRIKVRPGALIPRPETEELVQHVLASGHAPERILDIGTGSGCIALSLKQGFPNAEVMGMDRSPLALALAQENGAALGLPVSWSQRDLFTDGIPAGPFDIIVSNPPYIPSSLMDELDPIVKDHEPHEALFVPGDDPLQFFKVIAEQAVLGLRPGGMLWFETHHDGARAVARSLAEGGFEDPTIHKDLSGVERFVHARRREG